MEKREKSKRFLIAILIVLLLLTACSIYYIFDNEKKKYEQEMKELEKEKETSEVIDDVKYDFNNKECIFEGEDKCTKSVKMLYGGKVHELKIVYIRKNTNKGYNISYSFYVDEKKLNDVYLYGYNEYSSDDDIEFYKKLNLKESIGYHNSHEKVYILDDKYIGFQEMASRLPTGGPGVYLKLYNENGKQIGKEVTLSKEVTGVYDSLGNDLGGLENIRFDGHTIKFYQHYCAKNEKKRGVRFAISTDGEKIIRNIDAKYDRFEIAGAAHCYNPAYESDN